MQLETNERELVGNGLLRIENYSGYDFYQSAGKVKYAICQYYEVVGYDADGKWIQRTDNTDQFFIAKKEIEIGELPLTIDIINQWGADDQIIFEYVAQQINVTLL